MWKAISEAFASNFFKVIFTFIIGGLMLIPINLIINIVKKKIKKRK